MSKIQIGTSILDYEPKRVSYGEFFGSSRLVMTEVIREIHGATRPKIEIPASGKTWKKREQKKRYIVQMFNMPYASIVDQLDYLADSGYTHVLVSPPQKHASVQKSWWELYQPLDFTVIGNSLGTEEDLRCLTSEANKRSIGVLADLIVTHIACPTNRDIGDPILKNADFDSEDFYYHTEAESFFGSENFIIRSLGDVESAKQASDETISTLTKEFSHSDLSPFYRRYCLFLVENNFMDFSEISEQHKLISQVKYIKHYLPLVFEDFEASYTNQELKNLINPFIHDDAINLAIDLNSIPDSQLKLFISHILDFFDNDPLIVKDWYFHIKNPSTTDEISEWDKYPHRVEKWGHYLPKLNPNRPNVLSKQADLVVKLVDLGVGGFRFDSFKHVDDDFAELLFKEVITKIESNSQLSHLKNRNIWNYGEVLFGDIDEVIEFRKFMGLQQCELAGNIYSSISDKSVDFEKIEKVTQRYIESSDEKRLIDASFKLNSSDFKTFADNKNPRSSLCFFRTHDTAIGFFTHYPSYSSIILANAYILSLGPSNFLVYGSSDEPELYAGQEYLEKEILDGIQYNYDLNDVNSVITMKLADPQVIVVHRGSNACTVINFSLNEAIISKFNLSDGLYSVVGQDIVFGVKNNEIIDNYSKPTELHISSRSASYIKGISYE